MNSDTIRADTQGIVDSHPAFYASCFCNIVECDQGVPLLHDDRLEGIDVVLLHLDLSVVGIHVDQNDVALVSVVNFNLTCGHHRRITWLALSLNGRELEFTLLHAFDTIDNTRWPWSQNLLDLTQPEIALV